jgi:hypothetical protein
MIWAIVAVGFLIPVAAGLFTRLQPMIVGFAWAALVGIGTAIYVFLIAGHPGGSTPTLAVPFFALPSLAGGVPGGLLGWILQRRRLGERN